MNDDQILLANAYFDGELDADDRARAEADPVVLAEVERLSALATALADVPAPTAATREAAIAAALHEFDSIRPTVPSTSPGVVPITRHRRSRSNTWLAVAAGVLGIGLFGVVVAQNPLAGGDDDSEAGVAANIDNDQFADSELPGDAARVAEATAESSAASAMAADEALDAAAPAMEAAVEEAASAEESAGQSATAEASEMAAGSELSLATEAPPSVWKFDPSVAIPDSDALADVGSELLADEADGTLGTTPETRCGADADPPLSVLGSGLYQLEDGTVVEAWIAIDRTTNATYALDLETCDTLATTAPQP